MAERWKTHGENAVPESDITLEVQHTDHHLTYTSNTSVIIHSHTDNIDTVTTKERLEPDLSGFRN